MIKVFNVNVYGIKEALIRARYPMMDVVNQRMDLDTRSVDDLLKLGNTLGHTPHGHGDDKFLRQIFVSFDVLAPRVVSGTGCVMRETTSLRIRPFGY